MNRTNIIEHYKEFHGLSELTEDCQIDIDWAENLIEYILQVNKNCNIHDDESDYNGIKLTGN